LLQDTLDLPRKTRELHNHHMDSTTWNDFAFRDDDVIVATWGKSGTTWTQQIVGQLVFKGDESVAIHDVSPWLDLRVPPVPEKHAIMEAQTHRRIIKTHLPVDALVFSPKAKYLYIGRDGRDMLFSMYNHHLKANDLWYEMLNETPGLVGPRMERPDPDVRRNFRRWMENDGAPHWSLWDSASSWWAVRDLPNVMLVHFNHLKADLEGEMRRIAAFLEIDIAEDAWPEIVRHCTFDYMKANADRRAPAGGAVFEGGGASFFDKGTNGRWRDVLTAEDIADYERIASEKLGSGCARWLATGEPG
jgi:aryl sulfotransferase